MVALERLTDADLYQRGARTLVASWEAYAEAAPGASVLHAAGVTAAVFPCGHERAVYNNALLERGLGARERSAALDAMEASYREAGIARFAAWTHESDRVMRGDLERRGYRIDVSTRAMGMPLEEVRVPTPHLESVPATWPEHVRVAGLPAGFLTRLDTTAFHLLVGRLDGASAATAIAFDHDGDCGLFNVGTLAHARRRGLATALTARHLHDALARGCRSASLQATPAAERLYAVLGFRDLGRIVEYVP